MDKFLAAHSPLDGQMQHGVSILVFDIDLCFVTDQKLSDLCVTLPGSQMEGCGGILTGLDSCKVTIWLFSEKTVKQKKIILQL